MGLSVSLVPQAYNLPGSSTPTLWVRKQVLEDCVACPKSRDEPRSRDFGLDLSDFKAGGFAQQQSGCLSK